MQEEFTVKSVVDQYSPIWAELKAVIDQYPDVFAIHCGMGGYIMEVDLGTLEKQLESKRQLFKMVNEIQKPKPGSFITNMESEVMQDILFDFPDPKSAKQQEQETIAEQVLSMFNDIKRQSIPGFNLSDFQDMLRGQNYTQETIKEITNAIESYQSSLTAKRIALNSLTDKIAECKELAQIVYGKEIKLDVMFTHE
jgi:hypothetical protein